MVMNIWYNILEWSKNLFSLIGFYSIWNINKQFSTVNGYNNIERKILNILYESMYLDIFKYFITRIVLFYFYLFITKLQT